MLEQKEYRRNGQDAVTLPPSAKAPISAGHGQSGVSEATRLPLPASAATPGISAGNDFNVAFRGRIAMVSHRPSGNTFVFPIFPEPPFIATIDVDDRHLADRNLLALAWAAREAVIGEAQATSLF
jgi:hypothetical protein